MTPRRHQEGHYAAGLAVLLSAFVLLVLVFLLLLPTLVGDEGVALRHAGTPIVALATARALLGPTATATPAPTDSPTASPTVAPSPTLPPTPLPPPPSATELPPTAPPTPLPPPPSPTEAPPTAPPTPLPLPPSPTAVPVPPAARAASSTPTSTSTSTSLPGGTAISAATPLQTVQGAPSEASITATLPAAPPSSPAATSTATSTAQAGATATATAVTPTETPSPEVATLTATATSTPVPLAALTDPRFLSSLSRTVVSLTNQERARRGLAALVPDTVLTRVAVERSEDMIARDYFSHFDPATHKPAVVELLDRMVVPYHEVGENIVDNRNIPLDATTPAQVVQAWMHSQEHRSNILWASYTFTGVGIAVALHDGTLRVVFTQVFLD